MLQAPPCLLDSAPGNLSKLFFFIEELEAWVRCLECFKHPGSRQGQGLSGPVPGAVQSGERDGLPFPSQGSESTAAFDE